MNEIKHEHRQAMELLDKADAARRLGEMARAHDLEVSAYKTELRAANMAASNLELEPTRSVLFQSAATMAISLGFEFEAKQLIYSALSGNPPPPLRDELENMLEDISFRRHLQVRGVQLTNEELQLSISGHGIGYGFAPVEEVLGRIESARLLLTRTAERILNRQYRAKGREARAVQDLVTPMLGVPRAASYAVTLKLGRTAQTAFDGLGRTEHVVDELLECLALFADQDETALRRKIPDADYYRNFLALSASISPDGDVVDTVGFTSSRGDVQREVAIRRDRSAAEQMLLNAPGSQTGAKRTKKLKPIEVSGELRFADALKDSASIKLIAGSKTYRVTVPNGIDDIVRPLWGQWVTIAGEGEGTNIELRSIRAADRTSQE